MLCELVHWPDEEWNHFSILVVMLLLTFQNVLIIILVHYCAFWRHSSKIMSLPSKCTMNITAMNSDLLWRTFLILGCFISGAYSKIKVSSQIMIFWKMLGCNWLKNISANSLAVFFWLWCEYLTLAQTFFMLRSLHKLSFFVNVHYFSYHLVTQSVVFSIWPILSTFSSAPLEVGGCPGCCLLHCDIVHWIFYSTETYVHKTCSLPHRPQ